MNKAIDQAVLGLIGLVMFAVVGFGWRLIKKYFGKGYSDDPRWPHPPRAGLAVQARSLDQRFTIQKEVRHVHTFTSPSRRAGTR